MSLNIFRDQDCDVDVFPASKTFAVSASPESSMGAPATRSIGPDLVRAVAAILVVYLHASVAYLTHPMPGLVWATQDTASTTVSQLFWSIELFIMPLFLLLAGFFAYRSWIASGDIGLIRSRARRLLVPMIVAAVVLLPIDYMIWLVGWVIDGSVSADRLWPPKFPREMRQHLFGFGHLWFLLYVFLYCVVLAGFGLLRRQRFGSPSLLVGVIALPLVGAGVLMVAPEVVFGFQHAFAPVASKWLYSGTFFFGGVAMAAVDPRMSFATSVAERLIGVGVACGLAAIMLGQWAIERADSTSLAMDIGLVARILLAILTVTSAWTISLGLIGLGNLASPILLQRPRMRRVVSYLASASFWIYLTHHPLVALLHVDLKWVLPAVSPLVKSLITTSVAVGIGIASYEVLIRGRSLGRLLGLDGVAQKPIVPEQTDPVKVAATISIQPMPVRRAA